MVTISKLPPQTEAEISYLIESCGFRNATEVVIEVVHQLAQREKALADLRAEEDHELDTSGLPLDPGVC